MEMILTAQLVFAIFVLAAEKHTGTFIAPVGIGLALSIAELTGMSLNSPNSLVHALTFCRRLLDRRFTQPSATIRTRRRHPQIQIIPLDILDWSTDTDRLTTCSCPVQVDKEFGIRDCES